ncbi:MAG: helix-turn-helix domain-containing protein [Leisingera sp.]
MAEPASRLAATRTRLNRLFTRDTSSAPGALWLELRLNVASRQLLERNLSVAEVRYNLGFADTAHFCWAFKARFDLPPQAFRRKFGGPHGGTA